MDGDLQPAGSFSVSSDGTLTLNSGSDPLGPVQELRKGESWPATLQYEVSDGRESATGTVHLTVVGGTDQIVELGAFAGPDGEALDFNDPVPTVFDARGCYQNPEGFNLQHSWEAVSTSMVIPHDLAFLSSADVEWVITLNSGWGFGSSETVRVTALPDSSQAALSHEIHFYVGDAGFGATPSTGTLDAIPSCTISSGRPYAPKVDLPALDMHSVAGSTAAFEGNVLTNAIEPQDRPMTAGGQGYIGDPATPFGTYKIKADGTVEVTMSSTNPLPDGQQYHASVPYRAVGPDGNIGVGELRITVIGKG